ncbi:MAG: HAD-IA family hydrolase [Alphaproteobacteria bacterium]|nr:HAD-IA family hydrolase [Alphaproteobacteria bacterium]
MSDLRLIVFDCDGTLVDSQHIIVAAMNMAFDQHKLPQPNAHEVRRVVGLSLLEAVARLLPGETEAHAPVAEAYKSAFGTLRRAGEIAEPLFPQTRETLLSLSEAGFLLGVATGKSDRGLGATLAHHELGDHFITLQTADRHPGKPHPSMLEQAMREAGTEAANTLMVGDTAFDMEMAVNAGVHALGVGWGYHGPDELTAAGARDVLDSYAEFDRAIRALGWL